MSKSIKIITAIVVALVVLFAGTVVALGLVKIDPVNKYFGNYDRVYLYDIGATEALPEIDFSDIDKPELGNSASRLREALDKTSFSVLNSIISGKTEYKFTVAKNSQGELVDYTADEIEKFAADANNYMLMLEYNDLRTLNAKDIKDFDSDIEFDRVYIYITESPNEVITVRLIPVNSRLVYSYSDYTGDDENGRIDREFYRAYELRVNIYAIRLYNDLIQIAADVKNAN